MLPDMEDGWSRLRSFRAALTVQYTTLVLCNRFIDRRAPTHDQRVQAALCSPSKTQASSRGDEHSDLVLNPQQIEPRHLDSYEKQDFLSGLLGGR